MVTLRPMGERALLAEVDDLVGVLQLHAALAAWGGPATILLSEGDRTARRFRATWPEADPRVQSQPGVSHAFAGEEADWLFERLKEATASRH